MLAAVFFCACATASKKMQWTAAGPAFAPRDISAIAVYRSKEEIKRPWGAIGVIHGERFSEDDPAALNAEIEKARRLTAQNGGDAVIILENRESEQQEKEGYAIVGGSEMFLSGYAIKYLDNLTPLDDEAIKKWDSENLGKQDQ